MVENTLQLLRQQIETELHSDILEFWRAHAVDQELGGFFGYIGKNLTVDRGHDRGSVLYSRILWTYSAAYNACREEKYLALAGRAYAYIRDHFADREHSGVYWMLDCHGKPTVTKKQTYAQAFAIYGLSEYYAATQNQESLNLAIEIFNAMERHSHDDVYGGYVEALAGDWSRLGDMSLSNKDMNVEKSMNTHLHVLEAYTNLYRVWKDERLRARLHVLVRVMLDRILGHGGVSFTLFFDTDWTPRSSVVSYGHDIEGSWLLLEAAHELADPVLVIEVRQAALGMACNVLSHGTDPEFGGVYNERKGGEELDSDKVWWVQAEAAVGFMNAWELTKNRKYLDASVNAWEFISKHIIDREYGEWVWQTTRDGKASPPDEKVGPWKCPYHNGRMCMEMIKRIDSVLGKNPV